MSGEAKTSRVGADRQTGNNLMESDSSDDEEEKDLHCQNVKNFSPRHKKCEGS